MRILGPHPDTKANYEGILRSLPQWFGIEEVLLDYVRDAARLPTFSAYTGETLAGFVSLQRHFPKVWEIHSIVIQQTYRCKGFGRILLTHAEDWAAGQGARFLQVKTLAEESHLYPEYRQTHAFYQHIGYLPLEVFPDLWSVQNPCLVMIKCLDAR
ncbi:MAG: family N-acetyltransferase [Proteobacteria bacterium]|nr:family N-acetyltransferase [Pseudomonadota bacterium]